MTDFSGGATMNTVAQEVSEFATQLAFQIGYYSALNDKSFGDAPIHDGVNYYRISFAWYWGYGGSLNVQSSIKNACGTSLTVYGQTFTNNFGGRLDRDTLRLFSMKEIQNVSDEKRMAFASLTETLLKTMFHRSHWDNHYGICQSSFHKPDRYHGFILKEWAGRLLCDGCANTLSLTEAVYHRTGEPGPERSERDKMTPRLRWEIIERDKFTCQSCGRSAPDVILHVDHKIPIALGGKTEISNLHTLCSGCNLGKSAKMPTQSTLELWEQSTP